MSDAHLTRPARPPAGPAAPPTHLAPPPVPLMDPRRVYDAWGAAAEGAVLDVLRGHTYVRGPQVAALEAEFAARVGVSEAVAVDSGTDALILLLREVFEAAPPERREVIVPAFTFVATASAVVHAGGRPVFADVHPDTQNLDAASVRDRLTPATAAVIPVHLYGAPADMQALERVLPPGPQRPVVIEDAAQAVDACVEDRQAGALARAGAFSFYPSKNLGAAGDGGMVTTSDPALAQALRALRDHGQGARRYEHPRVGTNSRMDELQAAVLRAKLPHLGAWTEARRAVAARYVEAFAGTRVVPQRVLPGHASAWHLFTVRVPDREPLVRRLADGGIACGIYYPIPLNRQACFEAYEPDPCPVAERLAGEVLSLPCFPGLTGPEQDRVIEAVLSVPGLA